MAQSSCVKYVNPRCDRTGLLLLYHVSTRETRVFSKYFCRMRLKTIKVLLSQIQAKLCYATRIPKNCSFLSLNGIIVVATKQSLASTVDK